MNVLEGNCKRDENYQAIDSLKEDHFERTYLVFIEYPFFSDESHAIEDN
jgi:hypothetical protein